MERYPLGPILWNYICSSKSFIRLTPLNECHQGPNYLIEIAKKLRWEEPSQNFAKLRNDNNNNSNDNNNNNKDNNNNDNIYNNNNDNADNNGNSNNKNNETTMTTTTTTTTTTTATTTTTFLSMKVKYECFDKDKCSYETCDEKLKFKVLETKIEDHK